MPGTVIYVLYHTLTGQKPNLLKSALYVPSWCNRRLATAISRILGIKLGTFPFTYLGVPISPKRLTINQLQFIPEKVNKIIHSWNHSSLSLAGRTTLLNSSVFIIPNYILSVMNLPVSILDNISKFARNFLWGRSSNNSGFHSIGWTVTTLGKPEGGLGIRNFRLVNHSLMAKMCLLF